MFLSEGGHSFEFAFGNFFFSSHSWFLFSRRLILIRLHRETALNVGKKEQQQHLVLRIFIKKQKKKM